MNQASNQLYCALLSYCTEPPLNVSAPPAHFNEWMASGVVVHDLQPLLTDLQADCSNRGYHPYGIGSAKNPYAVMDRKVRCHTRRPAKILPPSPWSEHHQDSPLFHRFAEQNDLQWAREVESIRRNISSYDESEE